MKCWLTVCKIVLSVPLAVIGFGAWAWGVFCWAGGPDGRIGSPESILYGSAFGLAALVCAFLFVLLNGRKRWALLAIGLIYGAILLAVLLVADMGRAMRQGRTAEVPPNDPEAIYLLFPKDAEAELRRAVFVNGAELTSNTEDIFYYDGNESRRIARNRLSLYPPSDPQELERYLSGLNREIARWKDETDMRKIEFSHTGGQVKLIKFMKNGKNISYRYEIRDDGTPSPSTIVYGL